MQIDSISVNKPAFSGVKPISKKAYEIGGEALFKAQDGLEMLAGDVEIEVIAKKGFISNIRSLIIFVSKKGEKLGTWNSLSIDPAKVMPDGGRYKTVGDFTQEDIVKMAEIAKNRLLKFDSKLKKPSLPVDSVLLSPFLKKPNSCSIE